VERERREGEVVAAKAQERHAHDRRDDGGQHWSDQHGGPRGDAGLGVDEALVRIDADGEDRRRVGAHGVEGTLAERDLAGEPHQQRQPDRDERGQAHVHVDGDVVRVEPVGEPDGGGAAGERHERPCGCRSESHVTVSFRDRQPIRASMMMSAAASSYWRAWGVIASP
jgi:hypothetical protein